MDVGVELLTGLVQGGPVAILGAFGLWLYFKQQTKTNGKPSVTDTAQVVPHRTNGTPLTWADPAVEDAMKSLPDLIRAGNETSREQLKQSQSMAATTATLVELDKQILEQQKICVANDLEIRAGIAETRAILAGAGRGQS